THFFHFVFLPKVFLPDHCPGFHVQAMHKSIRPHGVNPSLLHDGSGRRAGATLGQKGPFSVMLLVAKNPKNIARLFLEAMHPLPGGCWAASSPSRRWPRP